MNFESYIEATESISEEAKIIKKQIDDSKGEFEFSNIQDWVHNKLNSFLSMYDIMIKKMDPQEAYYYQDMVFKVFNRTYFRKVRMLKMKKNGAKYSKSVDALLETFSEFKYWENLFDKLDLVAFAGEFSFANIFLLANRELGGRSMFEDLEKYSYKLKCEDASGEDKFFFQRRVNGQLETFIKDIKEKIINRLKTQYYLRTIPYLNRGLVLSFPDTIKEYDEGAGGYITYPAGEYHTIFGMMKEISNDFDENEFNRYYEMILKETDYELFIKKFISKFLS